MATKPRYVKSMEELIKSAENNPEFLPSTVEQIVIDYQTDPALSKQIVPQPIVPREDGLMRVVLSKVVMHISEGFDMEIGSGCFGVHGTYEGTEGYYLVTMPMTTEGAVIGGRETFGEPKKIAEIPFTRDGNSVASSITRHGMTYMDFKGTIGEELEPQEIADKAFCFKVFPKLGGGGFEWDPMLIQLNLTRKQSKRYKLDGELALIESPFDPVADLPIEKIVNMEYEVVDVKSNGELLATVPQENLFPFMHQRYDDFSAIMG